MTKALSLLAIVLLSLFAEAQKPQLVPYRKKNLWGYSDVDGKIIITPKYLRVTLFEGPYAKVYKGTKRPDDYLTGVIDAKGKEIIPPIYKSLSEAPYMEEWMRFMAQYKSSLNLNYARPAKRQVVHDSLYRIGVIKYIYILQNSAGRQALYTLNGKAITPFIYDNIQLFMFADSGFILRVEKNGLMGLMNEKGKLVKPIEYSNIISNDMYSPFGKHEWDVYYTKEKIRKNKKDERVEEPPPSQELMAVEIDNPQSPALNRTKSYGKMGMIGPYKINIPAIYDTLYLAESYNNRTNVIVSNNGKWGLVDQQNKELLPMKYSGIRFFTTDRNVTIRGIQQFFVSDSLNNWGIMNEKNKEILAPSYEAITPIEYASGPYSYLNVLRIKKNGMWGFLKDTTRPLLTPAYEQTGVPVFSNNEHTTFYVSVLKDGKWGVINEKNEFIIPAQFEEEPYIDWTIHKGYIITNRFKKRGIYILDAPEKSIAPQFEFEYSQHTSFQLASGKVIDIFPVKDKAGLEYYIGTNGVIFYQ